MVYVIGISFTDELLAKTAYEETCGYIFKLMSKNPSANDAVSAKMIREYANFPYQIPWYKFDFLSDVAELEAHDPKSLHNKKRQFALGLEFRMKSQHANAITKAAKTSGQAKLTIRTIVHDISVKHLLIIKGVNGINATNKRTELKTLRYATFTKILQQILAKYGRISEIAGDDEIMFPITGLKRPDSLADLIVLASLKRQGDDDFPWLVNVQPESLHTVISTLKRNNATLEHIFDYKRDRRHLANRVCLSYVGNRRCTRCVRLTSAQSVNVQPAQWNSHYRRLTHHCQILQHRTPPDAETLRRWRLAGFTGWIDRVHQTTKHLSLTLVVTGLIK